MTQQEAIIVLKDAGCAVTRPRREILERMSQRDQPFTPADVFLEVPRIGRATVFRTLELLQRIGILQRIAGSTLGHPRYIFCGAEHHHHLSCVECGRVVHLAGCMVSALEEELAKMTDFVVQGHHLEFVGTCQPCRDRAREEKGNT